MRVMLDTNIFISLIFFPSVQTRELARKLTESYQIVVCDYVIELQHFGRTKTLIVFSTSVEHRDVPVV